MLWAASALVFVLCGCGDTVESEGLFGEPDTGAFDGAFDVEDEEVTPISPDTDPRQDSGEPDTDPRQDSGGADGGNDDNDVDSSDDGSDRGRDASDAESNDDVGADAQDAVANDLVEMTDTTRDQGGRDVSGDPDTSVSDLDASSDSSTADALDSDDLSSFDVLEVDSPPDDSGFDSTTDLSDVFVTDASEDAVDMPTDPGTDTTFDADDGLDTSFSDADASGDLPGPIAVVIINEVLAEPDPSLLGDANCDGVSDDRDHFVELVNIGSAAADLSGWQIEHSDSMAAGGVQLAHVFDPGTALGAGEVMLIFGRPREPVSQLCLVFSDLPNDPIRPWCNPFPPDPPVLLDCASSGSLLLESAAGAFVRVLDSSNVVVDEVVYDLMAQFESAVRAPELTVGAVFVPHTTQPPGWNQSPGTRVDGSPLR